VNGGDWLPRSVASPLNGDLAWRSLDRQIDGGAYRIAGAHGDIRLAGLPPFSFLIKSEEAALEKDAQNLYNN